MRKPSGEWIWANAEAGADEYAEFYAQVTSKGGKGVFSIACDGLFELYVNGEIAAWGKYPDYPHYRVLDEREVTLAAGVNHVALRVWHIGKNCFTYRKGRAGALFELFEGDRSLWKSGGDTLSRISPAYDNHRALDITPQLGIGFRYDSCREDEWKTGRGEGFARSAVVDLPKEFHERPIELLRAGETVRGKIVQQGTFAEKPYPTAGRRMQHAGLFFSDPGDILGETRGAYEKGAAAHLKGDTAGGEFEGVYVTVDLGREDVGFVCLDFTVNEECEVEIGYGEHLADGRPRTAVSIRNFAHEYRAKAGDNRFVNYFRRMGLRYLTLFFHTSEVTVRTAGILPVYYPLKRKERKFENSFYQKIWDVSVRTLEVCMHDHYEDTPWREQSLYAMDSRNQMLFGYLAFGEHAFPRACLKMLAEGRREDGLLALCAPAGSDYPIPYFSLMFVVETAEYCAETGDYAFAEEVWGDMKNILDAHVSKMGENGLIGNFTDSTYWNFYEWTDGMDGPGDTTVIPSYDAPLNAFFMLALGKFNGIAEKLGKTGETEYLKAAGEKIGAAANEKFYDSEKGLYFTYIGDKYPGHFAELTNALFVVSGIATGDRAAKVAETLADGDNDLVKISMSHSIFKYDAMLSVDMKKYAPVVLAEVEKRYGGMLYEGATSFWETDAGEADFDRAGSLSHGWSAIPVYVFEKLGIR